MQQKLFLSFILFFLLTIMYTYDKRPQNKARTPVLVFYHVIMIAEKESQSYRFFIVERSWRKKNLQLHTTMILK